MDLSLFADLRDRDLRAEGLLVAEGALLVERLLISGWPVLALVCAPRFAERFRTLAEGVCPQTVISDREMAAVAGFEFHRGVLAVGRRPRPAPLDPLLETAAPASSLLACPDISGAANLGGIIRSAAAFGIDAVLLGPRSCDPLSRQALKASMGAAFLLPLVELPDERLACSAIRRAGYTVAVTSLDVGAAPLQDFRRPRRLCLVLGNEAAGVGEPWSSCGHVLLRIPMQPDTDSLNVGVAAGIFMHALRERR